MSQAKSQKTASEEEPVLQVVDIKPLGDGTASAGASALVTPHGRTIIHHDVVAKIAGSVSVRTPGVHALAPFGARQTVSAFARKITGERMRDLGVQVEVGKVQAAIDVRIVVDFGASIPDVSRAIRRDVRRDVQRMTGLDVVEVNIEVVDLFFKEPEAQALAAPRVA